MSMLQSCYITISVCNANIWIITAVQKSFQWICLPCPSVYEGCVFKFYPRCCLVPSRIFDESEDVVWFRLGYSMNQRTQRQPTSHQPASSQVPTCFVKLWVLATLFLGGDKRLEEGLKQNIYISANPISSGHSYRISCFPERYKPPGPGCT